MSQAAQEPEPTTLRVHSRAYFINELADEYGLEEGDDYNPDTDRLYLSGLRKILEGVKQ